MFKKVDKRYILKVAKEVGEIEIAMFSIGQDINHFMSTPFMFVIRNKDDLTKAETFFRENTDFKGAYRYAIWEDEAE